MSARAGAHGHLDASLSSDASFVSGMSLADEPGLGALTIPGYLREVTARFAEREALVWRSGLEDEERWSYATLWERSFEVACTLVAAGVGRGTRVGVLMTNRPEQLAAAFGTALAGGVSVLLNTFATPRELAHMLELSGIGVLLFERQIARTDFAALLVELEPQLRTALPGRIESSRFPFLRHVAMAGESRKAPPGAAIEPWPEFLRRGDATPPALVEATAAAATPADEGVLFFSSGTTSLPKGVMHGHRAVALQWWRWGRLMGMQAPVRSWTANGFFWSGNFSMVVGGTFSSGGSLVLQPTFDPAEALALMERERVSFALAWPHQWAKLEEAPNWQGADLSHLRYVKAETPGARHPTVRTDWLSPPSYGCTETLTISTAFASTTRRDHVAGSHGEVLPGNTLKIVDPHTGAVLPRGARGEVCVKGPTLMLGYVGIPLDETLDEEGFFRSGDQGVLDEAGRLFWEGRLSEVIKTGGANVSPREVDGVLASHPAVRLSQTVGIAHETLGELVVSCVVLHDAVQPGEAELRRYAREHLASYKVPSRVLFFRDDELEMTGSDKVKTSALRQRIAERLAAIGDDGDASGSAAAADE